MQVQPNFWTHPLCGGCFVMLWIHFLNVLVSDVRVSDTIKSGSEIQVLELKCLILAYKNVSDKNK